MTLSEISDLFLNWIVVYGPPVLALALFTGALGVPLPGTLFVIAAGAFVRQEVLSLVPTLSIGLVGVVLGDTLSFGIGRVARSWIDRRFAHTAAWQNAAGEFQKRGGVAVYLTRWLLTPIAVPVNLVAGTSGYSLWSFVGYDLAGELTWILLYGTLGYIFGSQWEAISTFVSDFSGVIVGVAALLIGAWLLLKPKKERPSESAEVGMVESKKWKVES